MKPETTRRPERNHAAWARVAAAGLAVGMVIMTALYVSRPADDDTRSPSDRSPGVEAVDVSAMTPREAADHLFDRVMRSVADGDHVGTMAVLPQAIDAYGRLEPLDADGAFHLSTLQRVGRDFEGALATAQRALVDAPNHVLVLIEAMAAALALADTAAALEYAGTVVNGFTREVAKPLPEYTHHRTILPNVLRYAERLAALAPRG